MSDLIFTILGCGSSGGVPRLADAATSLANSATSLDDTANGLTGAANGAWGACDPANPRNRRSRCSMLVTRRDAGGDTRLLIDTSPDMRAQLLTAGIGRLDAVAYTHAHADHTHGLDDLRMVAFNRRARLPVWADAPTAADLLARFGYAFQTPPGSSYPPILDLHDIAGPFRIDGDGGPIDVTPIPVHHGDIDALGFRIGGLAYIPDLSAIPETSWPLLAGLDVLVIDALRTTPHPSHTHLSNTLALIARAAPARAYLTDMHFDLDYAAVARDTPETVTPAHDGLTLTLSA